MVPLDPTRTRVAMSTCPVTAIAADGLTLPPLSEPIGADTGDVLALVEAARLGDRDAFGALVVLYERAAVRTALAALRRREDAEDAAQDGFVAAWEKLVNFRGQSTFRTWLLTIVWRKALDRRRRRQRWWHAASPEDAESVGELCSPAPDPERAAAARDVRAGIAAGIKQLSPKLKDALLLAASGEHTYDDIARLLGVPCGTAKWRVSEARKQVTAFVEKSNHEPRS